MNPNWLGVTSAILALAAFYVMYRLAKPPPFKRRLQFFGLAWLLAIPGASFSLYYLHWVTTPAWYFQFRSIPGTELLTIFIGVADGIAATLPPRRYLVLPLLATAAFSIAPFIKPFIGPLSADTFRDHWHEDVCMQSTRSTCGAASTATILKRYGMDVTEAELAREAHSYAGGTEAWYLARSIRSRGFNVEFHHGDDFHPELGLPAIIGVRIGIVGHFIPILEQNGDEFVIGDPLRGREVISRKAMEERYDFSGFHIHITPNS